MSGPQQVDNLFFVIGEAASVELFADGRIFRFLFFVLVENPFQCAALVSFGMQ
jgi:hypothetical protein